MPAPRVTIPELPALTTIAGTELLVVQDGSTTKKIAMSLVTPADLAPRITALEAADVAFDTRVDQVETVNTGQDGTIASHNAAIITNSNNIGTAFAKNNEQDTRLDGHDTTIASHTTTIGTTTTNVTNLTTRVTTAESNIAANGNRITLLEANAPTALVTINTQTGTSYTLVAGDLNKLVTLNNAAAVSLVVPGNATVPFATGSTIDLAQLGVGQVTVSGTGGATITGTPGLKCRARYSAATLIKVTGPDTWLLVGDLSA